MDTLSYFRESMKSLIIICSLFLTQFCANAQKIFEFNATCVQSYQEITKLKIKSGKQIAEKAKQENKENLIPLLLESYGDFYTLFFNENPEEYELLYPKFQERINELLEGPKSSPFYLYSQAIIRIQRAGISVKFGHLWEAGWDFRKAYQLLKENKKQFPNFSPNELMYGALESVISTVPKGYKWISNILGMKGSISEGMQKVKNYANSNDPWAKLFFNDAAFIYPYLLFFIENKKEQALNFVQQKKLDLVNNHLNAYMAANLALNNKEVERSKSIIQNRNLSEDYLKLSVWDFQMGYAQLYHLDYIESIHYFESFIQNFKGKFYVKDVYQKLSWCYYLQGNIKLAEDAQKKILSNGSTEADADKKALKDAKANYWPNQLLLKARLLNDGGYHNDAYKLLAGKSEDDFVKEEEKLEFAYRSARIYDDLGKKDDAIRNYLIAIKMGINRKEYFAARAALQIAQIYEARGQINLAIDYYQKCLNMSDHEFKDSLDQKAKSGIARCKGE